VDLSERQLALNMAIMTPGISAGSVVDVAENYLQFMQGRDKAPAPAPAPAPEAAAPKASRGKKAAATSTPAEPNTAATAEQTAAEPTPAATASASNDMFGEEAASPKASPTTFAQSTAPSKAQPSEPSASSSKASSTAAGKAKVPTLDEVRAAMVDVQTKCGGKEAAKALLVQFTTDKKPLYSALPEEKYGALIAACKKAIDVAETTK
jgi:hypothetical protein